MADYSIGISGLDAAQKALDMIGNNIANAATEGYHRQTVEMTPAYSSQQGSVMIGGGVDVGSITRVIDILLEQEILRQQSSLGQVSQELLTLQTVENVFGELPTEDGGLNAAIDKFFNSLMDLSAHPGDIIWQNQTVSDAETMTSQFSTVGEFLNTLEAQILMDAESIVESINTLTSQIAELNNDIKKLEISGGEASNLRDQRDKCISDLSELVGIQTQSRESGVVDVTIAGIPVVVGSSAFELETGLDEDGNLGISIIDTFDYKTDVEGGKLGALLTLKNEIVYDIHDDLDTLATEIINQINQLHAQGVGSEGSFTELTGWAMTSEDLADFDPPVTDGYIYIRITDTSTGTITREPISVDADAGGDSLTTIAAKINAISGSPLSASVDSSNRLTITANGEYEFDFLPAVLPEPTEISFSGSSDPTVSVSGIYKGGSNDTLTFTVTGTEDNDIGNGDLGLLVTDSYGTVAALNIGSGYAAGDIIEVGDTGIQISLSMGDLAVDDYFEVDVFAESDISGVLAAVGLNCFFSGSGAADIAVCSDIADSPTRIATCLGADMDDNTNAVQMAEVKDMPIDNLDSLTCGDFYRRLVADIGQQLSVKQMRQDCIEVIVQNLANKQSDISGVDINEEATQLLVFEQMFQAMAKYMNTVQAANDSIMQLII
jgi:flagellar hook-associated protein FlgK